MLQYHLPHLLTLRSQLSSGLAKLRSVKYQETSSHPSSQHYDNQAALSPPQLQPNGPYTTLDSQPVPPQNLDPYATYEFGQLKSIQTFIRNEGDRASDDQIHLTHEIEQQQDIVYR